jgi:hypothetical protein
MAYDHSKLRKEVRDVINATLPELSIILEVQQGDRRNFAGITVPFCVVVRSRAQSADWGIANLAYERQFDILLCYDWDDSEIDAMEERLEVLKSALFAASYSGSQATLISEPEIDTSPENAANAIILNKNLQLTGGTLSLRYVCGESATSGA